MKKFVFIIIGIGLVTQSIAQKVNNSFLKFTDLFFEVKDFPYKNIADSLPTTNRSYKISLLDAKKYLHFNNNKLYATEYDYNYDENKMTNIRRVENSPGAREKILNTNFFSLVYIWSSDNKAIFNFPDTLIKELLTFNYNGQCVDSIMIWGQLTRESDWTDFVFLSKDSIRLFKYNYNMENYEIKNGLYNTIDLEKPRTIVEIIDYKIDDTGHIKQIGKPEKIYLKEGLNRYKNYHPESDDPMNKY